MKSPSSPIIFLMIFTCNNNFLLLYFYRYCRLLFQTTTITLLSYHIKWLDTGMTTTKSQWIFALLIRIDKLLTSNQMATLREMCRKCISIRKNLVIRKDLMKELFTVFTIYTILNTYTVICRIGYPPVQSPHVKYHVLIFYSSYDSCFQVG